MCVFHLVEFNSSIPSLSTIYSFAVAQREEQIPAVNLCGRVTPWTVCQSIPQGHTEKSVTNELFILFFFYLLFCTCQFFSGVVSWHFSLAIEWRINDNSSELTIASLNELKCPRDKKRKRGDWFILLPLLNNSHDPMGVGATSCISLTKKTFQYDF